MARMYAKPPTFSQVPSFIREDVPVYMLEGNCYFDDTLWLAGAILETSDTFIPNSEMFPLNQMAYDYMCAMLGALDEKGLEWQAKEKKQYILRLPLFQAKWEKINHLAQTRRISLIMALKTNQVPILGAPQKARTVTAVDMTSIPQLPYQDDSAIGKGNTMDKDMSAVNAVRQSVA